MTIPPDVTFEESPQPTGSVRVHPKLDSVLNQLLATYDNQGLTEAQAFAERRGLVLEGQSVKVTIITVPAKVGGLREATSRLGAVVQGDYQGRIEALVSLDSLVSIAELPEVQQIRVPQRAVVP